MDSCFRKNSDKKNKEKNEILSLFSNGIKINPGRGLFQPR